MKKRRKSSSIIKNRPGKIHGRFFYCPFEFWRKIRDDGKDVFQKTMRKRSYTKDIVIYQAKTGAIELKGDVSRETIWATQAQMAKVFNVTPQNITLHLRNAYKEGELSTEATCKEFLQVQKEGNREIKRRVKAYNLDVIIAVGYRINSIVGTRFRQWATKTLRDHITKGYTINRRRIARNYDEFMEAVDHVRALLPAGTKPDTESIVELIRAFADTWLSLEAYDKDTLADKGATRKSVTLTAEHLSGALADFKTSLVKKGETTELFGQARHPSAVEGIAGNVMQSFGGKPVYPTVEEKAAHLLYFLIKDHPFVDGNKRSGAFAFVWFLQRAGILKRTQITPEALTALTLLVAESDSKNKNRMIRLVLQLLKK